jgi:hypothetical protein
MNTLLPSIRSVTKQLSVVSVLLLALPSILRSMSYAQTAPDPQQPLVVIYLIDNSESIARLPEPDTMRSWVAYQVKQAALSGRPIQFAAVIYSGKDVKVIGSDKDLPTSAHNAFLQKLSDAWGPPKGGTPLDIALSQCAHMIEQVPEADVQVVHFGDGEPSSNWLRIDDFPPVQNYVESQLKAIDDRDLPEKIKQELKQRRLLDVEDPSTDIGKRAFEIQAAAEFELCLQDANALRSLGVRFVTVDFAGVEKLRQIHKAAGGIEQDYVAIDAPSRIVASLHELNLTAWPGLIIPPPIPLPVDSNGGEVYEVGREFTLDPIAEAATIFVNFDAPIAEFHKHVTFELEVGGSSYLFSAENNDPQVMLTFDRAKRVTGAILSLDSLPKTGDVRIRYESPEMSMKFPGATVFVHLRMRRDLRPIFQPVTLPIGQAPPHSVSPEDAFPWISMISIDGESLPLAIIGGEVVLHRDNGDELRIPMELHPEATNTFISPQLVQIPDGKYNATLHITLPSGFPVAIPLKNHIIVRRADEYITFELDESSLSKDFINLGQIGDARHDGLVTILVRTHNIDQPVSLQFLVVGLSDSEGKTPGESIFKVTPDTLTLQPGRPTKVRIQWKLPNRLDNVLDGPFSAKVDCIRLDRNKPVDIRPFHDSYEPINEIRFDLHRPEVFIESTRAFRTFKCSSKACEVPLAIRAGYALPFDRDVVFAVYHDSSIGRTVRVDPKLPVRNADGVEFPDVTLVLKDGQETERNLKPGEKAKWVYELHMPDDSRIHEATAEVVFAGDGLQTAKLPLLLSIRPILLHETISRANIIVALLCGLLGFWALARCQWLKRWQEGKEFELSPGSPREGISVSPGSRGGVFLEFDSPSDFRVRKRSDSRLRRVQRKLLVDNNTGSPDYENPVITKLTDDGSPGFAVEVLETRDDGGGDPIVTCAVYDAGPYADRLAKSRSKARRRILVCMGAMAIAIFATTPLLVSAWQWIFDAVQFH